MLIMAWKNLPVAIEIITPSKYWYLNDMSKWESLYTQLFICIIMILNPIVTKQDHFA